jgi:hypothetical protein
MPPAATLAFESVPFAAYLISRREEKGNDLFVVVYVAAIGLLLTAAALIDDANNFTTFFGLSTEASAAF